MLVAVKNIFGETRGVFEKLTFLEGLSGKESGLSDLVKAFDNLTAHLIRRFISVFHESRSTLLETLVALQKKFKMWPMFIELERLD